MRRARRANTACRQALLEAVRQHLGDRVTVTGDGSGAHIVLLTDSRRSEEEIIARAAAMDVGVYGISRFFLKRTRQVGLMLGYTRMKEEEIREAIRRLAEAMG